MSQYKQGDIVYTYYPFNDLQSGKRRPAVVVCTKGSLILVKITSRFKPLRADYLLPIRDEDVEQPMDRQSYVEINSIFTITPEHISHKLSTFKENALDTVLETIKGNFEKE